MSIKGAKKPRRISAGLSTDKINLCKDYIKGAVHGFCNNNSGARFSARSLFGGENTRWQDTPLVSIYDYYIANGYSFKKAHNRAGIDVGWLLKTVLYEDDKFEYQEFKAYTKEYCRII